MKNLPVTRWPIPQTDPDGSRNWTPGPHEILVGLFHFDGAYSTRSTWLSLDQADLSVHYGIDRLGAAYLFVDPQHVCYHAGESRWLGRSGVNSISVGVEVNNFGWTNGPAPNVKGIRSNSEQVPDFDGQYYCRKEYGRDGTQKILVTAQPGIKCPWDTRTNTRELYWTRFTSQQIEACSQLAIQWLSDHSKLVPENIVGHEHVSPGRKLDPGPAFREVWCGISNRIETWAKAERPNILDPEWNKMFRVKGLQSHLSRLGCYKLGIDGDWGPKTQDGLELACNRYEIGVKPSLENITTLCNALRLIHI